MIAYASNTGTARNLQALRDHNWSILLTPLNPNLPKGFTHGIDNGAWTAFQQKSEFDHALFTKLLLKHGPTSDFVVVPDIVAGGTDSLLFSKSWIPKLLDHAPYLLLPVQDGMVEKEVITTLIKHARLGIFLGGSTEYKLENMFFWGRVANQFNRKYHVGRVNTVRRIYQCGESGASSFDGTSATRFAVNVPHLEAARRLASNFVPRYLVEHTTD